VDLVQGSFNVKQELLRVRCAISINDTTQGLS
jgi:hypothetical protein